MSVDQIYKKILCLLALLSLGACQPQVSPRPRTSSPAPSRFVAALAQQPPVPLKPLGLEPVTPLHVIASLSSRDRHGQRRLQLYLSQPAPDQAFYWQVVRLYRSQYDTIWIYTRPQASWSESDWPGRAAWFAPGVPPASRHPDFSPSRNHDGLYWRHAD